MTDKFSDNNIPELESPFEQLREVDGDGKGWQSCLGLLFPILFITCNKQMQVEKSILSKATKKFLVPSDKWSGEVVMYNLDVVISVGYRVNGYEVTQFLYGNIYEKYKFYLCIRIRNSIFTK